jgi:hypothetical protein
MSTPSLLNIPYLYKAGTLYSQIPESGAGDFTVSRTTTPTANRSTRINKDGLIELVNDNVPRLDYPLGGAVNGCPALLVEPAATNSIRNNSMVGAVAGLPGTLPTNFTEFTLAGLSREIVATGTESGIPYIDYRIFGNANSNATRFLAFESTTQIVASSGQRWTNSVYAKVVSAPNPPSQYYLYIVERNAGGGSITSQVANISIGSSLTRFELNSAPLGATTERVQPTISFLVSNGQAYDFTIRIGYPQMELGSVATSVIPTTTAAVTRSADIVRKTNIASLIGQSEGTVYFEVEVKDEARNKWFFTLDSASNSFIQAWINSSRQINIQIQNGGNTVMTTLTSSALSVGYHKVAFAYNTATNGCKMFIDGVQNPVSSRTVVPPGLPAFNNFSFGTYQSTTSDTLKAHVRAGELYPTRIPDTAAPGVLSLATLTAL